MIEQLSLFRLMQMFEAFQKLDESEISQLGFSRFSLQVAALKLSEAWRRLVSHPPALIHKAVWSHSCSIERTVCGGLALRNSIIKLAHRRQL